jgi:hypothetical protein
MKIIIQNEKTGTIYSKEINITPEQFYSINEEIFEDFFNKMESKYATMDFTGGKDFIKYTLYEIEDENLFLDILNEWFIFINDQLTF